MQNNLDMERLLAEPGNLNIIWQMGSSGITPAHDIETLAWRAQSAELEIAASGNDPIVLLPQIEFAPDKRYFARIAGEAPDSLWQIFYISEPGQTHSGERMLELDFSNANGCLWVELPTGIIPQQLRLDPGSLAGQIRLKKIEVYALDPAFEDRLAEAQPSVIYQRCQGMEAASWASLLKLSVGHPRIGDMEFPAFPDAGIQIGMVGSSCEHAIAEMEKFYSALQAVVAQLSWGFTARTRILDFGCGFGRLTRFFLKDVPRGNLYGADTVPAFIAICRRDFPAAVMPHANFIHNEPLPPLEMADGSFDLITAYSVFTHLKEEVANAWIREFHRLLKPGGLLVITLRQRQYLEHCRQLARQGNLEGYAALEAKAFGDYERRIAQYEAGEFIWEGTGGGDHLADSFYGDAIVPPQYVTRNWGELFRVREMFDQPRRVAQAFVALQKI